MKTQSKLYKNTIPVLLLTFQQLLINLEQNILCNQKKEIKETFLNKNKMIWIEENNWN